MRGMASVKLFNTPPPGRYKIRINAAEPGTAKSGNPKIALSGEVIEPAEHAGAIFFDNIVTDGATKGAGFSKAKLIGLGIKEAESDADVADEVIATQLTGVETWAEMDNQPRFKLNPATNEYDLPVTEVVDGKQVQVMNLTVSKYLGSFDGTPAASTAPAKAETAPSASATTAVQPAPDAEKTAAAPVAKADAPWKKKAAPTA